MGQSTNLEWGQLLLGPSVGRCLRW